MSQLTFKVKTSYKTKYGFNLRFTYNVIVDWFYTKCRVRVTTYHKMKLIYEETIPENRYNRTVDKIRSKMERGEFKDVLVKDYGRCVACKHWMDDESDSWKYDEYDMFCSRDCQRKPIADKCKNCPRNVPRSYTWGFPGYCCIQCFSKATISEKTLLSDDIIKNIVERI